MPPQQVRDVQASFAKDAPIASQAAAWAAAYSALSGVMIAAAYAEHQP